jgi:hypothetical protein
VAKRRRDGTCRELRRLRESLTDERKLDEFRKVFERDPASSDELNQFIEYLTLEMYNSGRDALS